MLRLPSSSEGKHGDHGQDSHTEATAITSGGTGQVRRAGSWQWQVSKGSETTCDENQGEKISDSVQVRNFSFVTDLNEAVRTHIKAKSISMSCHLLLLLHPRTPWHHCPAQSRLQEQFPEGLLLTQLCILYNVRFCTYPARSRN